MLKNINYLLIYYVVETCAIRKYMGIYVKIALNFVRKNFIIHVFLH